MASALPPWVTLSLRETITDEQFVQRAEALGVRVAITREGLAFPGGFLGVLEPRALDSALLDRSLCQDTLDLGPTTLHLSGGTNELARAQHREHAQLRAVRESVRAALDLVSAPDPAALDLPQECAAARKVRALTQLVHALCPLATAVVLPRANHLVRTAATYAAAAEQCQSPDFDPFPLWSYLKLRDDAGQEYIQSIGTWVYALPDAGLPISNGVDRQAAIRALAALRRATLRDGHWPEDGAELTTELGPLQITHLRDDLWLHPREETPAQRATRHRHARLATMFAILTGATHFRRAAGESGVAIEHFLRRDQPGIAITNGVSTNAQRGGTPEGGNDFVELSISATGLGPWADGWLDWAALHLRGDGSHPVKPYDRLALPEPRNGLAGAILWPSGNLKPYGTAAATIQLWDVLPILTEELAAFRQDPQNQTAWLDARDAQQDFTTLHERWQRAAPPR